MKTIKVCVLAVLSLCVALSGCARSQNVTLATPGVGQFYRVFNTTSAPNLIQELSGSVESVTAANGLWTITAGGVPASTHYARLKYKIPEFERLAPTAFYMKATVVLPADFYSRQTASFRLIGTGNSGTTLNGQPVGTNSTVAFTSVSFDSDQLVRVQAGRGNTPVVFWRASSRLPVGEHVFEFYGDVAKVAPWYLRIDGVLVASGTAMLQTSSTPINERVVTRLVAGIDGAADLDSNSMTVQIREFVVANYDAGAITPSTLTPTRVSTLTPTLTSSPSPTFTPSPTMTPTLTPTPLCFNLLWDGTWDYCK
jgi:hypothetical protein